MQRINNNIDQDINWNDPDSIDNYAPEDQFEYIPYDPTIKDHIIYFLRDNLTDPIRFFFIKRFKKKMKFDKKITTPGEAKRFIHDLCKNDLAFHFDDDVQETFKERFEDLEIKQLDSRINEIFEILEDPFEYLHKYWVKFQTKK